MVQSAFQFFYRLLCVTYVIDLDFFFAENACLDKILLFLLQKISCAGTLLCQYNSDTYKYSITNKLLYAAKYLKYFMAKQCFLVLYFYSVIITYGRHCNKFSMIISFIIDDLLLNFSLLPIIAIQLNVNLRSDDIKTMTFTTKITF